jgi:glyoxylase-like metal-dependent hydrolase (beta-lactamase superfamily II)/rhodanese-related sulfurtransferase
MLFRQVYLGCLAHASYLIGSDGEAAVVDPQRDVDLYLEEAARAGLHIKYVIETHLHADFVSGHRELAERTGAQIVLGARATAGFAFLPATDGMVLEVGRARLRILETPGHTPESISVLVTDGSGEPARLLTGDTLFVGEVGRPDLVASVGYTADEMAGMLYDSLRAKILTLPDETEIWPAHGAGSACGRNIGQERSSTIGQQRRFNYALQPMTKERFIATVTEGLPPAPRYFGHDAELNRAGAPPLGERPPPRALTPEEAARTVNLLGAIVVDVRTPEEYARAHVPASIAIGLEGSFAPWAGTLLALERPILLVASTAAQREEAVVRLARVGLDRVIGFLDGGVEAWGRAGLPLRTLPTLAPSEARARAVGAQLVDVRRPAEWERGRAPGAVHIPLDELAARAGELDRARPVVLVCGSGYRSTIAAGVLEARGYDELAHVGGGMNAWTAAGLPVTSGGATSSGSGSGSGSDETPSACRA